MGNEVQLVTQKIMSAETAVGSALPAKYKSNVERFTMRAALTFKQNPDWWSCDPNSIVQTMVDAASWGLMLDGKLCYGIKYGNKLQAQPSYIGLIQVAKRNNVIRDAQAEFVYEHDTFERGIRDGRPHILWEQNVAGDRGKKLGVLTIIWVDDSHWTTEFMTIAEIHKVRDEYAQKNSPAWKKSPGEMEKKVALRRHMKLYTDNADVMEIIDRWDRDFDVQNNPRHQTAAKKLDISMLPVAMESPAESPSEPAREPQKPDEADAPKEAWERYNELRDTIKKLDADSPAFSVRQNASADEIDKVCVRMEELIEQA